MSLRKRIRRILAAACRPGQDLASNAKHLGFIGVQELEQRLFLSATPVITGNPTVHEGTVYTLNLNSHEVGSAGIARWDIGWGDGETDQFYGDPSTVTHEYEVNESNCTINASVTENGSAAGYGEGYGGTAGETYSATSLTVSVLGNPPTTTVEAASVAAEANVSYSMNVFSGYSASSSNNGTIQSVTVHWGDGSSNTYNASSYSGGTLPSPLLVSHTYSSSGGYLVTAAATDQYSTGPSDFSYVQVAAASLTPFGVQTSATIGSVTVSWINGGSATSGATYSIYRTISGTTTQIASGVTASGYTDPDPGALTAGVHCIYGVECHSGGTTSPTASSPDTQIPQPGTNGSHTTVIFIPVYVAVSIALPYADPNGNPAIATATSKFSIGPMSMPSNTIGYSADFVETAADAMVISEDWADVTVSTYYNTVSLQHLHLPPSQGIEASDPMVAPFDTGSGNPTQWAEFVVGIYGAGSDSVATGSMAGVYIETITTSS